MHYKGVDVISALAILKIQTCRSSKIPKKRPKFGAVQEKTYTTLQQV